MPPQLAVQSVKDALDTKLGTVTTVGVGGSGLGMVWASYLDITATVVFIIYLALMSLNQYEKWREKRAKRIKK